MINVTLRIPSDKVKYGYIEISGTPKEIAAADPVALAADYVNFMAKYIQSERDTVEANRHSPGDIPMKPPAPLFAEVAKMGPTAVVDLAVIPEETVMTPDELIKAAFPKAKVISTSTSEPWVTKSDEPVPPKPWEEAAPKVAEAKAAPAAMPTFDFS